MMRPCGWNKPGKKMNLWSPVGFFLIAILMVSYGTIFAQEPLTSFGQSNPIMLNTNSIGFGETAILMVSGTLEYDGVPGVTKLGSFVPNPFNPLVTISFNVGRTGSIEVNIYDLAGRCVSTLASGEFKTGEYFRQWDGRDNSGSNLPAGVYLVRIKGATTVDSKKITLLK